MDINSPLLNNLKETFIHYLPKVLGILLFIVISWILFKIVMMILKKILRFSKIDILNDKINNNKLIINANISFDLKKIILVASKWIILLLVIVIGAGMFELEEIASGIGKIIAFLPTLLTAILILALGIYLASYVKTVVNSLLKSFGLNGANAISSIACYAILVITIIIALNKLSINTDIITDNLSIILGAVMVSVAIAFGLGSKEIIQRLLFGFYSRKSLKVGQTIRIDETEGTIVAIDNIFLILQCENQKIVYPIKTIVNKKIEVME